MRPGRPRCCGTGRPGFAPSVAAAIAQAAAGNPLALVELPATLTAGQRAGTAAIVLPLAPGRRRQRAFWGRVGALGMLGPPGAADRRGVRGARPGGDRRRLPAGTDVTHLGDAEASGLVRIEEGPLDFAHPLIRGLVYTEARAAERRAAHAALAATLGRHTAVREGQGERRHLGPRWRCHRDLHDLVVRMRAQLLAQEVEGSGQASRIHQHPALGRRHPCDGHATAAGRVLNVPRQTLGHFHQRYGLQRQP